MPLFPLRSVLFPTMVLPLHVFEPRYRTMVHDLLEGDGRFGVVMIERGSETGGEDQRSSYGTVARIVESEEYPDGRWGLITVGVERFRVSSWLEDDPYPKAEVELWPDADADDVDPERFAEVEHRFRRCMALASEMGIDTGPLPDSITPCGLGTMQLAALLPVGPHDKQRLLGVAGCTERLDTIDHMIDEALELIELKLREG